MFQPHQLALDFETKPSASGNSQPVVLINQPVSAPVFAAKKEATSAPPTTQGPTLAPALLRHPRANRQALLGDKLVAYELRRGKRRTIGFLIGPEGLTVSASKRVPLYEIEAAVQSKSAWIVKKLGEMQEQQQRMQAARIEWRDGALFPFLGQQVSLVLAASQQSQIQAHVALARNETSADQVQQELHLALPSNAQSVQIRDAVQSWLQGQAERLFTERLNYFAPQLGVRWRKLALSNAATRWGSAEASGMIRLNWRLIHFELSVIDYVVVHELSHLRVMNHSPRFWDVVRTVIPNYRQLRGQLKQELPQW